MAETVYTIRRCPECASPVGVQHHSWCSRWDPPTYPEARDEADHDQYDREEDLRLERQFGAWPEASER